MDTEASSTDEKTAGVLEAQEPEHSSEYVEYLTLKQEFCGKDHDRFIRKRESKTQRLYQYSSLP